MTQKKAQQLGEIGIQDVVTQEPTSSKILVEAAIQLEANELEIDKIPDQNLEDLDETPGHSQETELVQEESQHEEDVVT